MNKFQAAGLVVLAVAVTAGIEEYRIAKLRESAATAANTVPAIPLSARQTSSENGLAAADERPTRVKDRPAPAAPEKPAEAEEFGKSLRKMWDNPAAKSMMNQGVKMAVVMMYGDFIEGLDLSKEEADYFRSLLGKEVSDQQELGMKILSASPEEQKKLMEDMELRKKENEKEIAAFLNNETDQKSFEAYKERLPEKQQLDGIRQAMTSGGEPLDPATETKLVDAMHRARTQPDVKDYSGAEGLKAMSEGNLAAGFEENWEKQQTKLKTEVGGILSPKQQELFFTHQSQLKDMQMNSLKMAEQMMGKKGK